jgi:hypothetical protein
VPTRETKCAITKYNSRILVESLPDGLKLLASNRQPVYIPQTRSSAQPHS